MPHFVIKNPEGEAIIEAELPHTAFGVDPDFCVVNVQEVRIIYEGTKTQAHSYTLGATEGLLSATVDLEAGYSLNFPPGAFKIKLGGTPKEPT
jgi:hypothetical protein